MTAYWITGDTRAVMAELPAGSVDLVLTSSPFLALRSYLPDDDPAKVDEIGSEANPAEFIDTLLDVTEACARLLAPHGTLCVELGDKHSGSGGGGGDYSEGGIREGQPAFDGSGKRIRATRREGFIANGIEPPARRDLNGWPQAKSLALIPEAYRMALAYGRNPHNGRLTDPWRIRNVIRWVRNNPPVGALGDKWRPATSEMVVACKSDRRWFDLDSTRALTPGSAVRAPLSDTAVGSEHRGALHADDRTHMARWRCDLRFAQVAVNGAVAGHAKDEQIVELVGLDVRLETSERAYVVDLQSVRGSASLAGVEVAVESCLSSVLPVGAAVLDPASSVCGAVLSTTIGAAPLAVAFKAAEVVSLEGALISGDRIAARLTLEIDGTVAYARFVAPLRDAELASWHSPIVQVEPSMSGAPPLDWWLINPKGYSGAHYATWPPELCIRPIEAMCPRRVCLTCGKPSRRLVDAERTVDPAATPHGKSGGALNSGGPMTTRFTSTRETAGWSTCGCPGTDGIRLDGYHTGTGWRPGIVLDPFGGSGTTASVASGHSRDSISIDLDRRNVDLARDRIGMWFQETTAAEYARSAT